MRKNVFATGLVLAAVLGLASGPRAWAKPSDLPLDEQIQCPEGEQKCPGELSIEWSLQEGRLVVQVEIRKVESPTLLDTVTPSMLAAYCEQTLQQLSEHAQMKVNALLSQLSPMRWSVSQADTSVPVETEEPARAVVPSRAQQADQLFKLAESCRRLGQYSKARIRYQQVHLLLPTSRVGQLAIDRLMEIEERMRDNAEEADVPAEDHEQSYHDLRGRSVPLGLVEVSY